MNDEQKQSPIKIGIIGGGQLAKMMGQVTQRLGFYLGIYDPDPACPAASMAHEFVQGSYSKGDQVAQFAKKFDVVTYDLEHVNVDFLLEQSDLLLTQKFWPRPETLKTIQDKQLQKEFYLSHDLPTAKLYTLEDITYPCVWKARCGGYDGRGVRLLNDALELKGYQNVPHILEASVDIKKELAVMVVRDQAGDIKSYPCVDMHVDSSGHVLDYLSCPAQIDEAIHVKAQELAVRAVQKLKGVGVFGVELFLDKSNTILINEIAPRPHNSGHHTIEAFNVSQFEQHIRAVCGLPLAELEAKSSFSATYNLLSEPAYRGEVQILGLNKALKMNNVFVHIYGKTQAKPGRKMGHVTVLGQSQKEVKEKVLQLKQILKIRGKETY